MSLLTKTKPFTKEDFCNGAEFTAPFTNLILKALKEPNINCYREVQKKGEQWFNYCTVRSKEITDFCFRASATTIFFKDFSTIINFSDLIHFNDYANARGL